MKLIDLLVQELPKLGGWPRGAAICERFLHESHIDFYDEEGNWPEDCGKKYGFSFAKELVQPRQPGIDIRTEVVKKDEYESALAASKQIEWNGRGLPPVGCECEAKMPSAPGDPWKWRHVKVVISGMVKAENECLVYDIETTRPAWVDEFRPGRTEAERKREVAISSMIRDEPSATTCMLRNIYDAIAAGKIPGIKLSD